MLLVYGEALQSTVRARQIYAQRYPDRRLSNERTFMSCSQRLLDTGSVVLRPQNRGPQRQINPETEEEILNVLANDPSTSTR